MFFFLKIIIVFFYQIKNFAFFFFYLLFFFFSFEKNNSFSFFFSNKFFFKSFISHFKTLYVNLFFFFFFKYKLKGLGYRVKYITKNLIRFFIGTTNFYYMHVPFFVFVRLKGVGFFWLVIGDRL
jgi:hypothetical protein